MEYEKLGFIQPRGKRRLKTVRLGTKLVNVLQGNSTFEVIFSPKQKIITPYQFSTNLPLTSQDCASGSKLVADQTQLQSQESQRTLLRTYEKMLYYGSIFFVLCPNFSFSLNKALPDMIFFKMCEPGSTMLPSYSIKH